MPDARLVPRPPHDLERAMAICCRQHDPGPPGELARGVAVGDQGLKLCAVSGAKVKADVGASYPPIMPQREVLGNPVSGGEH